MTYIPASASAPAPRNRIAIAPLARLPAAPARNAIPCHLQGRVMGTFWSVRCYATIGADQIRRCIQPVLDRANALFSHWQPDSEISAINNAPCHDVALSAGFADFLAKALALAEWSGGAFDPSLGALADLWGFGPRQDASRPSVSEPPAPAAIAAAQSLSGWHRIALDPHTRHLRRPPGLRLDFSGCAKGWAVDQVSDALAGLGILSHMVEIGGEVVTRGLKPDLHPWWIMVEHPPAAAAPLLVALSDQAMASSGDYRHAFIHGDRRYCHTIGGTSGAPVQNPIASVTVLAGDAMRADALASALMVMGPDRGMDFASRHDLPAVFFLRHPAGMRETVSPAFQRMLSDADDT